MKKLLLATVMGLLSTVSFAQGNNGTNSNWKLDGNSINTGEFLGTTNSQDLVFKTNNNEGFRLDLNGKVIIGGVTAGMPTAKLTLNGNMLATGDVLANGLSVVNFVRSDKGVLLNSVFCFEGNDGTSGSTNRMWSMNGDMYIQSSNAYNFNTIFNNSNTGNVGIGTSTPQEKLDVGGNVVLRNRVILPNLDPAVGSENIVFIDAYGDLKMGDPEDIGNAIYDFENEPCPAGNIQSPVWQNGVNKIFTYCPQIKVGIGTDDPLYDLDVRGNGSFSDNLGVRTAPSTFSTVKINGSNYGAALEIEQNSISDYGKLLFLSYTNPTTEIIKVVNTQTNEIPFLLEASGKMTLHNGTRKILQLEESGLLHARKIRVDAQTWPDYVFAKNYVLKPLTEVEAYIKKEQHLPGVPSEEIVLNEGIDLGEMNVLLMQKVEELTLYLIEQDKTIRSLQKDLGSLKEELNTCEQ